MQNSYEAICNGESIEAFSGKKISFIRGEYLLRDDNRLLDNPEKYRRVKKYLHNLYQTHPETMYRLSDLDSGEMIIAGYHEKFYEKNTISGRRGHRNEKFLAEHYKKELELIIDISDALKLPVLKFIIPFISSLRELYTIRDFLYREGKKIRFIPMIETPCILDEILSAKSLEFDEVVVGLNDLTSLYYGITREENSIKISDILLEKLTALTDKVDKVTLAGNITPRMITNTENKFTIAMHLWNGWGDDIARQRIIKIKNTTLNLKHEHFKLKVIEDEKYRIYTIYEQNNINK